MNQRTIFRVMVLLLAMCGLLLALLRHLETGTPFLPSQEKTVWLVEARIDFVAIGQPVKASLSLPEELPGFELYDEQAASPGYGFAIVTKKGDRRAEWTRRNAVGKQSLYYTAHFVENDDSALPVSSAPNPLQREAAPAYLDESHELAAKQVLARAKETSSDSESFTRELIKLLNSASQDQNTELLLSGITGKTDLLILLLNRAGIDARPVAGLYLEDARRRQALTNMVEIHAGDRWLLFDPETGATGVPPNLLLWHRGGLSLLDVSGGRNSRVSFSMIEQTIPARQWVMARDNDSLFFKLGVNRLPIEEQSMFKLLLLLPLGAIVVVFMRIMVGLRTAGTFMPILISLAFLQTSLIPGLISFVSVVAIGLAMRSYLSRLNLLLVSRIATLIVLVVFVISAISIIGYQLGYSTGMTITFFPMIIIAWTIERMSILWEEEGPNEVLVQGSGSLFVAVVAYALMQSTLLQHLSFNFPELNLVLLALILAMGQYTGYKLSELRRFRTMSGP